MMALDCSPDSIFAQNEFELLVIFGSVEQQEGHDGPVSLHWLIREIHPYQTLHYLGIGLKHKTPYKD